MSPIEHLDSGLRGPQSSTVFHPGEQRAQELAGVREYVLKYGLEAVMRQDVMPQNQLFFASQPLLYLASMDSAGRVWASCVAGQPGFVSCPTSTRAIISPLYLTKEDPLAHNLREGCHIGGLAIRLDTRKRVRLTTRVVRAELPVWGPQPRPGSLELDVDLSFGSCPKYIQGRALEFDWSRLGQQPAVVHQGGHLLGSPQAQRITNSDTFFLATCFIGPVPEGVSHRSVGCDISHRGGPPGFVTVQQEPIGSVLKWAEYSGNNMFQSLGNLMANPHAGLIFIDYSTGDTLQLTGTAVIDYDDRSLPGAMRVATFTVHQWIHAPGALPVRQSGATDWSVFNPEPEPLYPSGACAMGSQAAEVTVKCLHSEEEAKDVRTFIFTMPAGPPGGPGPAPTYSGGQYGIFLVDDGTGPVQRTWTVTSHPSWTERSHMFKVTVKRSGRVSSWMHEHCRPGQQLVFKGFAGKFTAQLALEPRAGADGPLEGCLLLAGGIGITPLHTILMDLVLAAGSGAPRAPRRVILACWVRGLEDAALTHVLHETAEKAAKAGIVSVRLILCTTRPGEDVSGYVLQHLWERAQGHINAQCLAERVLRCGCVEEGRRALSGWHTYLCGPPAFMSAAERGLQALGADMANIHTESFQY